MLVRNATESDVADAARAAGVSLMDLHYPATGRGFRFRLSPNGDNFRRYGFSKTSRGNRRRINAVCWHGHLAFFRELYARVPNAFVHTSMADYRSVDDLESLKYTSRDKTVGSMYDPVTYGELCECDF